MKNRLSIKLCKKIMIQKLKHMYQFEPEVLSYQKRAFLVKFEQVSEAFIRRRSSK